VKTSGVVYVVAGAILAVFVVANWQLLMQPVEMNFLVARVQAPLAVLLLLLASVILLLDFGVHAFREHAWIRDRRTLARDLEAARLRAEQESDARTAATTNAIHKDLAIIRAQLDRVLATQPTSLRYSADDIEPELVPPREPSGGGVH
jgi:uncharacterized integral membrane protein